MFIETLVPVSSDPAVDLFVVQSDGSVERPLLVIHGGPDWDHTYLREPVAELADHRRIILPDLRGCGRSTRGLADDEYTPAATITDLVRLLDTLEIERADILGFSYGGLIAQRLVLAVPERVRRLVVASSSVLPVPPDAFDGWHERTERMTAEAEVWSDPSLSGPELTRAAALASAPANVWRPDALPGYLDVLKGIYFSAEWMRPWQAGTLPSPRHPDTPQRLADVGIPMLLLHGRQDMTFPADLVEPTVKLIPTARASVLEEAGHMAHIDQPRAWLAALEDFLSEE
ncbi:alpha/beta hydrolase [Actinacidiphila glaucinigra]|uniref:alpha/beta fold hydrolase n=1 Tax=Actinacidiphila glaucinigra TaxID=235986 RepID=UPI002DDC51FE|nr:alpha/beta hydrolase [Actinacidiphila glaucinigra]WSD62476.1 alpha/beta hydrolase [Actinacidiphila glaucinigra]